MNKALSNPKALHSSLAMLLQFDLSEFWNKLIQWAHWLKCRSECNYYPSRPELQRALVKFHQELHNNEEGDSFIFCSATGLAAKVWHEPNCKSDAMHGFNKEIAKSQRSMVLEKWRPVLDLEVNIIIRKGCSIHDLCCLSKPLIGWLIGWLIDWTAICLKWRRVSCLRRMLD